MMMSKTVWQDSNLQPPDYKSGSLPHNHNFLMKILFITDHDIFIARQHAIIIIYYA